MNSDAHFSPEAHHETHEAHTSDVLRRAADPHSTLPVTGSDSESNAPETLPTLYDVARMVLQLQATVDTHFGRAPSILATHDRISQIEDMFEADVRQIENQVRQITRNLQRLTIRLEQITRRIERLEQHPSPDTHFTIDSD